MRNAIIHNLTKDFILSKTTQEEIFSTYLSISVATIYSCINNKKLITSVFRSNDKDASMGFILTNSGKIHCTDFGGYFSGDCFDAAGYVLNLNANNKNDFVEILKDIYDRLIKKTTNVPLAKIAPGEDKFNVFDIIFRDYYSDDLKYWKNVGTHYEKLMEHDVYCIDRFYINGRLVYYHKRSDPGYAFFNGHKDGRELWKIYFPKRPKGQRYWTNGKGVNIVNRIHNAQFGGLIKSKKDLLAIESCADEIFGDGFFQGVETHSESVIFTAPQIGFLNKYWKRLLAFSDFDRTGMIFGCKHNKLYNVYNLHFTDGRFNTPKIVHEHYAIKDFCDFCERFGRDKGKELVEKVFTILIDNGNMNSLNNFIDYKDDGVPF